MFITHNSAQLYTVEFGKGPRTILAHGGWTGSWELWAGPFRFYDRRGTGATTAPVESISIENMVADVFAVMDQMDIETCVLAAESAGGIVAVTAVLQQLGRFESLVLIDTFLHNEDDGSDAVFVHGLRTDFVRTVGQFADACVPETEPNSMKVRSWGRKILTRASPESSVRLLEATHGIDLRPSLAQIRIPTLVIHGDQDNVVPLRDSENIAAQVPNCCLRLIKGAGHVPTVKRPNEVAQEIDLYFLEKERYSWL